MRIENYWAIFWILRFIVFAMHYDIVIAKPVRTLAVAISGVGFTAQIIFTLWIPTLRSE